MNAGALRPVRGVARQFVSSRGHGHSFARLACADHTLFACPKQSVLPKSVLADPHALRDLNVKSDDLPTTASRQYEETAAAKTKPGSPADRRWDQDDSGD